MKLLYVHALYDLDLKDKGFLNVFERRLKAGGHFKEIHVLSAPGPGTPAREGATHGGSVFYHAPAGNPSWLFPQLIWHLVSHGWRLVQTKGIHAVWASDPTTTLLVGWLISWVTRKPLFLSYQSDPHCAREADGRRPLLKMRWLDALVERWACQRAVCTLYFNGRQESHLKSRSPCVRMYRNTPQLDLFLNVRGEPGGDFAWAGLFSETKNPLCALEAFLVYRQHRKGQKLHFFGEGPLLETCRQRAAGIEDILFHGFVDQRTLASCFKSCSTLLHSSSHEGFSNTLMEAQAAGLVPIVADLDVIKSGMVSDARLTFTSRNPQSMAERMLELDNNPELWKTLSQRAKADLTLWWTDNPDLQNRRVFEEFLGQKEI